MKKKDIRDIRNIREVEDSVGQTGWMEINGRHRLRWRGWRRCGMKLRWRGDSSLMRQRFARPCNLWIENEISRVRFLTTFIRVPAFPIIPPLYPPVFSYSYTNKIIATN